MALRTAFSGIMLGGLLYFFPAFIAGLLLFIVGWRHKGRWSSPWCVKCKYDLSGTSPDRTTQCPECGADLALPRAIQFAEGTRSWRLLSAAIFVWLFPILLAIGGYFWAASQWNIGPAALPTMTNAQVLQQIVLNIEDPGTWSELEARLVAGKLSQPEVETAIDTLINYMVSARPEGWRGSLYDQEDFIRFADASGFISDEQMLRLCEAYYGDNVEIQSFRRTRVGSSPFEFAIDSVWFTDIPVSMKLFNSIKAVRLDGEAVPFTRLKRYRLSPAARLNKALTPGEHELEVEVESAYITSKHAIGIANYAGLSSDDWPPAIRRWTRKATRKFYIYGEDEAMVEMVTNAGENPVVAGALKLQTVIFRTNAKGKTWMQVQFIQTQKLPVPVSGNVRIVNDGKLWRIGRLQTHHWQKLGPARYSLATPIYDVPAGDTRFNVEIIPDASYVEHDFNIKRIWGKKLVFEDVKITRYGGEEEISD